MGKNKDGEGKEFVELEVDCSGPGKNGRGCQVRVTIKLPKKIQRAAIPTGSGSLCCYCSEKKISATEANVAKNSSAVKALKKENDNLKKELEVIKRQFLRKWYRKRKIAK